MTTLLNTLVVWINSSVASIPGNFTQIDLEDGGYLPVIVQHSSGRLFGRTDGGGVYRSDDHGDSWQFLGGDFTTCGGLIPQGIAVCQTTGSDSNLVLQATGVSYLSRDPGRGIWKSTNGGAGWTHRLRGVNFSGGDTERLGGECLIFHPTIGTELWAGSRGQGLWKSTDSGETWTEIGGATLTNVIFSSLCIHPSFPDQIFAAGDGGLWLSLNHGSTWTKLKTFDLAYRVVRKANGTVFLSGSHAGASMIQKITASDWTDTNTYTFTDLRAAYLNGLPWSNNNPLVCLAALRDGRLVAGDQDAWTRISTNDGASFTTLPQTPVAGVPVPKWASASTVWRPNSLTQDGSQTNRWYGGGGYGPMRTDDGGQTWRYIVSGIGQVVTYKVGFHPTDPDRIYIPCADHAAAIITDGGRSGKVVSMATQSFPWPDDIVMFSHRALAATVGGSNRVIFPGGEQIHNRARIYVTFNDGASWTKAVAAGLPTTSRQQIVDAVDSLDNPDDFLVVCGGTSGTNKGGIYRTTSGGASFTQCSGIPSGLDFGDLFYWNVSLERDATNLNERYLFLRAYPTASGGGFFHSLDRGATWTHPAWPLLPDWYGTIAADHVRSGNLWVSFLTTSSRTTNGLARSTNGGNTWSLVSGFANVLALDALDGHICLFGARTNDACNKIYYSTNDGATWDEITRPGYRFANVRNVACDPHRPGRVWISTDQRSVAIFTPGTTN